MFARPIDGVRAIVINLRAYRMKHGLKSVHGIIRRWTKYQADEAGRERYILFVCERLKVERYQHLDFGDPYVLKRLTKAIIEYECGYNPYPKEIYRKVFP